MSLQKSSSALLKISSDGLTFEIIAGLKQHQLQLQQQAVNASSLESGAWRKLADATGHASATIRGEGLFADSSAEQLLLSSMLSNTVRAFQLCLPNGNVLEGDFLIVEYIRRQNIDGEEAFAITLESAGGLTYT